MIILLFKLKFTCFFVCLDIDDCAINTGLCHEDAICTDTLGSYICTCANGYHGNGTVCKGWFWN